MGLCPFKIFFASCVLVMCTHADIDAPTRATMRRVRPIERCREECKDQPGTRDSVCGKEINESGGRTYFKFRNQCEIDCMNKKGTNYKNTPMNKCPWPVKKENQFPGGTRDKEADNRNQSKGWWNGTGKRLHRTTPRWEAKGNTTAFKWIDPWGTETPTTEAATTARGPAKV